MAQYSLGAIYYNGWGVSKDYVQSYMWHNVSSANGNVAASKNRNSLEKKMIARQILQGQELSSRWIEKHQKQTCIKCVEYINKAPF